MKNTPTPILLCFLGSHPDKPPATLSAFRDITILRERVLHRGFVREIGVGESAALFSLYLPTSQLSSSGRGSEGNGWYFERIMRRSRIPPYQRTDARRLRHFSVVSRRGISFAHPSARKRQQLLSFRDSAEWRRQSLMSPCSSTRYLNTNDDLAICLRVYSAVGGLRKQVKSELSTMTRCNFDDATPPRVIVSVFLALEIQCSRVSRQATRS